MREAAARSIQGRLYERLEKAADRPALAFYGPDGMSPWTSLEDIYSRAASTAARLAEEGLRPGETCIIVLPSGPPAARLVLAALLRGAVPVLVAPPLLFGTNSNLAQILGHTIRKTQASLVVGPEGLAGMREQLERARHRTRLILGEASLLEGSTEDVPRVIPTPTDPAAMQLTSGTTGLPRICRWDHRAVLAALDGMTRAMSLSADDVCFNWTPLYHDMGLVNNFLLCLTSGVPLVLMNPQEFAKSPALWLRGLSASRTTVTWSPNFGFAVAAQRITDEELEGVELHRVRAFWNAAERIHLDTMLAFQKRFARHGVRLEALKTNFGCAENVGGATFSDPNGMFVVEQVNRDLLVGRRVARPVEDPGPNGRTVAVVGVGRPYPGMKVRILARNGTVLPDGRVGEIALETPSRMQGYLKDARATRRALQGGRLRTGDLGYTRDGELFWVGRVRERITVRGKKLDPSDFEATLLAVPHLREGCFAVFGIDAADQGTERIVLVSEVREPIRRDPEDISGEIRRRVMLDLGVSVSEVVLVKPGTLSKTSSGKRRHRHFRKMYLEGELPAFEISAGRP